MKKKIIASMLSAVVLMSALASCGGNENQDMSSSTSPKGDEVVIEVFTNLPDRTSGQGLIEQMLFDQYMAENPNVRIEVEALEDESYKTKFKAYASGSDMPDLISVWGQPSFSDEVIEAGLLAELNPEDYKDYNFIDGSLTYFMKNDKLYGLPRTTDVMAFYYNKALFEQYDVEVPKTYDDLLLISETFKENNIVPVSLDGADRWPTSIYLQALFQQFNGPITTEVKTAVDTGDYSNPAWNSSLELLKKSVDAGLFQVGFETTDYATALNLFTNNQAAMYYMGSWEMSMVTNEDLPQEFRDNISIFNMPTVDGGLGSANDITAWNGGGHSVTTNSDVKDEAIKLLNFMYLPENWSKLCWENGVGMSAQNFGDYTTGSETSLQLDFVKFIDEATSITSVTFNDLGTNEYKTVSEDATAEFVIGKITAQEFLDKLSSVTK